MRRKSNKREQRNASRFHVVKGSEHCRGEIADRVYGNVWTRIWRRRNHRGEVYFNFSQHRLLNPEGKLQVSRTFTAADPSDVAHGALWARDEIRRLKQRELTPSMKLRQRRKREADK